MDRKKQKFGLILVMLILLLMQGCQMQYRNTVHPLIHNGRVDLRNWTFHKDGVLSLDGDWEFYWNRLVDPGSFSNAGAPTGYYPIPKDWRSYKALDLPSKGRGTYCLAIQTDGENQPLSILVPQIYTEYALWINGELIHSEGSFAGRNPTYQKPVVYDFDPEGKKIQIVLQIRNELHAKAGLDKSILLGTREQIHGIYGIRAAVDLILFSVCLIAGLHHLTLYHFRKKDKELFFFGGLCLLVSIRSLISNTTLLMQVFPSMPFWLGSKLFNLTVPLIVLALLYYSRSLFPEDLPRVSFRLFSMLSWAYVTIVVIGSPYFYTKIFPFFTVVIAAAQFLWLYLAYITLRKKRPESWYYLFGVTFFAGGVFSDILAFFGILNGYYILPAAMTAFITSQILLIAKRYSESYTHAEQLTVSLRATLEKATNAETAFLNAQIKPHFLYNTLNTIAQCCETDPRQAEALILSLSKYLRGTLDFENLGRIVPLSKELDLVKAYLSIEQARFDNIGVAYNFEETSDHMYIPPLTLQPLVENAIKHGLRPKREGGMIHLSIQKTQGCFAFSVADDGCGISKEKLETILCPPEGAASIGLYNIHTRLIRLYGKGLHIEAETGSGTTVSFEVPYEEKDYVSSYSR